MYFHLQTSELLLGKAFNIIFYILHFDVRNVSYSKSLVMLKHSLRLLIHYLKFGALPIPA